MASDLEGLTRRELLRLSALGGLAAAIGISSEAEAKPDLPEVTERDFEANVYKAKNPVIVLFHDATPASQRMERVIDVLYHQYSGRVDFYRFDVQAYLRRQGGNGPTQGRAIMRLTGVPDTFAPKTMMYASFDVVTGKRYSQNVVIDALSGGPVGDLWVQSWVVNTTSWIDFNLLNAIPDNLYIPRFLGKSDLQGIPKR